MMIAELVDLEEFADHLRELGLALPVGADESVVKAELETWLDIASADELCAFERVASELEAESGGMILPSVTALIAQGRSSIPSE